MVLHLKIIIDDYLFRVETVIAALVVGAILMIGADKLGPKNPKVKSLDQISYRQAFTVGLVQCFSLWPGFSRSGATISGGVLFGMNHRTAADFTFIMAVPIMIGASLVSVLKNWEPYVDGLFIVLCCRFRECICVRTHFDSFLLEVNFESKTYAIRNL